MVSSTSYATPLNAFLAGLSVPVVEALADAAVADRFPDGNEFAADFVSTLHGVYLLTVMLLFALRRNAPRPSDPFVNDDPFRFKGPTEIAEAHRGIWRALCCIGGVFCGHAALNLVR